MPSLVHRPKSIATPINASYPKLLATLDVEKTTVSDFPKDQRFQKKVKNARAIRSYLSQCKYAPKASRSGFSKYPFGRMKIGHSFFVPLFAHTKEEQQRVENAVSNVVNYHVNRGNLPVTFILSSVLSNKDGRLGIAFFRV
jgi:hypothetical protein